jgi:hypothetical protein
MLPSGPEGCPCEPRPGGLLLWTICYFGKHLIGLKAPIIQDNLQAKSLKVFCQKYPTEMAIRTSMSDFRKEDWLTNLPLYAIF